MFTDLLKLTPNPLKMDEMARTICTLEMMDFFRVQRRSNILYRPLIGGPCVDYEKNDTILLFLSLLATFTPILASIHAVENAQDPSTKCDL